MGNAREMRKLLRLVLGRAAAGVARRLGVPRPESGTSRHDPRPGENAAARAALAAERCRRAISKGNTERERLIAQIRRYDDTREVLIAREASEPDRTKRDELRRSLKTLDARLGEWLDEHDALTARIAGLEADLAFIETLAAAGSRRHGHQADTGIAADPGVAPYLEALGLLAMPATLIELKAAYRARLKAVHPDVGSQPSTEAAAAATVAFGELRKHLARSSSSP